MEIPLSLGDGYQRATVAHRKRNINGELISIRNNNPILDTSTYEGFPGGGGIRDIGTPISLIHPCFM